MNGLDLNFDDGDGNDDDGGDDDDSDGGCMQPAVDCSRIHKKEDRALAWISTALACKLVALISFWQAAPFFTEARGGGLVMHIKPAGLTDSFRK